MMQSDVTPRGSETELGSSTLSPIVFSGEDSPMPPIYDEQQDPIFTREVAEHVALCERDVFTAR